MKKSSILLTTGFSLVLLLPAACSNYEPVKISECKAVAKHTGKILGKLAKSQSVMIKECKKLTDIQRGCAMAASTTGELMKCSKL